jgi:hypothetical protein
MDLSGALELGADSAQRFLKVLVERSGLFSHWPLLCF